MRIKNQFIISMAIFSAVLLIVAASVIVMNQQITQLDQQQDISGNIEREADELNTISSQYFLYQQTQQLALWQSNISSISGNLSNLNFTNSERQTLVNKARDDLDQLNSSFTDLVSFLETAPRNVSVRVMPEFQNIWNRMVTEHQTFALDASQLADSLRTQADQLRLTNIVLIIALLGIFGAFFLTNYLITYRRTLKSISNLQAGIKIIGSGNLDYTIQTRKEEDEISELSQAFNHMTANLKTVTASKTDLEQEIIRRKQAETSLRENERRWATTLASIGDAVIATDVSGRVMFMNGVAEELTGWTLSEASLKPVQEIFKIVNEQTRIEVEDPVSKILEKGLIVGLANHTVLIRKDGTEVAIDDSGAPIKDKDGKTTGVVLVFRDITERKKVEEQLRESENGLAASLYARSLIEASLDPLVTISADGKITDVNKATELVTGCLREQLIGSDFADYFTQPEKARQGYQTVFTQGFVKDYPLAICHKSGKITDVLYNATVYRNEAGKISGIFAAARDVTEQRRAEESLRRQAALIDLSPDGIVIEKPDGTITFWSLGAEKLYGWAAAQAVGQKIHILLKAKFPEPFENINIHLKQEGRWSGELIHHTKLGRAVAVQSYWLAKFDECGEITEIFESNVDITERKDAEHLAAIGQTAGMVGHDIRNPLQSIIGELYLAKDEVASLADSNAKENLNESIGSIEENIIYINKIVADLQDFARPLNPVVEESDLENIIDDLLLQHEIPENIKADSKVSRKARIVMADSAYLKRILGNLISNAIQAMPNGGKLSIEVCREADKTVITVEDSGIGIPEEVRPKLFQPLFTTKSKGQGFGLAVVKRMIEALNGTVTFKSEVGKGTKFIIRLPHPKR